MQFTRTSTLKYIIEMAGELHKMAENNSTPLLSNLLKMAQIEGKDALKSISNDEKHSSHS